MSTSVEIFILFAFALAYCTTLGYAHILLARIDRKVKIHRPASGEITIKNVKALIADGEANTEIRKAIAFLKINSVIAAVFFGWLILNCIHKWR
jgi:hypothetical protein